MDASLLNFVAIAVAYAGVCLVWLAARGAVSQQDWPRERIPESDNKRLDLGLLAVGILAVFGVGQLYRRDLLTPDLPGKWSLLSTSINLSLPFMPLLLILLWRKQSLSTVMLSSTAVGYKFSVGCVAALVGLALYLGIVGELDQLFAVLRESCSTHSLAHAPAVFLEGVGLAFAYERLRWVIGGRAAIWIPCVLFAAAHVPRSLAAGRPPYEIAIWFAFNTVLPALILHVVAKSRDVIWIAIPHYILDVAIGAFH